MEFSNVLSLLSGLALFLYGMKMMSDGLELTAGDRLKGLLEKVTSNLFMAVLVGALITALVQSSSATTVMTVGFVSAGLMTLKQAVGVIMGANVGTTITGLLIALDMGEVAPLFAIVGVVMIMFIKNHKVNSFGLVLAGLGILFIGMETMGDAMKPLRDEPAFVSIMTSFSNPFLGVGAGAAFTAIIQSSSASIGILQNLADTGLITLGAAAFVLFGQNIGTCITALISSLGASRDAKRVAFVHLVFNVTGALLFIFLCMFTPLVQIVESWFPSNVKAQIANMHVIFNIATTLILLPFAAKLEKLSKVVLKDEGETIGADGHISIPNMRLGSVTVALFDLRREVSEMYRLCAINVNLVMNKMIQQEAMPQEVYDNEEKINQTHREIIRAIPKITSLTMTIEESKMLNSLYKINNDIERIGDHAINLTEETAESISKESIFSPEAKMELEKLRKILEESLAQFTQIEEFDDANKFDVLSKNEDLVDSLCEDFRLNQMERIKSGCCEAEASVIYSEILINVERIADYVFNIARMTYADYSLEQLHKKD